MEMNEVAHILQNATDRSLIILDEVGRGTGTFDGLSVAWAVSRYLVKRIKGKTLFATHYLELNTLAELNPPIITLSILVEEEGERIVFLHKILPGQANKSYGIHVARLAGLPGDVIEEAMAKLAELEESGELAKASAVGAATANGAAGLVGAASVGSAAVTSSNVSIYDETIHAQQAMFAETAPVLAKEESRAADQGASKVLAELKKKNLMSMSPLDALNYLYRLQQTLNKDKG